MKVTATANLPRDLPSDIRAKLDQVEEEYQNGELTQRGYELRRSRIMASFDMPSSSLPNDSTSWPEVKDILSSNQTYSFADIMLERKP